MKIKEVTFTSPKDKKAALNLAAYIAQQHQILSQKEENFMAQIEKTEDKMKRLQKTLESYKLQIEQIDRSKSTWNKELQRLMNDFQLTQAEILETQSELLRKQISSLQKQAGVQDTGKTSLT